MKTKTISISILILSLVLLAVLLSRSVRPTTAQELPPPQALSQYAGQGQPALDGGPVQTADGTWVMLEGATPAPPDGFSPEAIGGPDDFGYIWDDSVPLNWIDATNGTDTGMSGSSNGQAVGPIALPFSFKFYEKTYNNLYITASGYVAFTPASYWAWQPIIPSTQTPNNIVAPYATPLYLASNGPANRVYYKSGGTAPNRYFVIEWYQVQNGDEFYTFEVILHENGDVVFQYQTMSYNGSSYSCGTSGIEDSLGYDGLNYVSFCSQIMSNKAVRFFRPPPSARVSINPRHQGQHTHAGEATAFPMLIRNNGEFGTDTYDLFSSSAWSVSFFAANGVTPLTDTDSDGAVDTGPVPQGGTVNIVARVQTPGGVVAGANNTASVTARSSINTTQSKTSNLQTAVPAPFAQVFTDGADDAQSLYLAQPGAQTIKKASPDFHYGYDMAVAETPDSSFVYAWINGRCINFNCNVFVNEIIYTLLDKYGQTIRLLTKLTDHSNAAVSTYDYDPAIAVAPNGRIGLLWYRYLWNNNTSQYNYNLYFAVLDPAGNVVHGPVNVTNNTLWGTGSDFNVPRFDQPRLAATDNNRFVLAWHRAMPTVANYLDDIFYTVRDSNGGVVTSNKKLTNDTGQIAFYDPALTSIANNRAFLSWINRIDGNDDIHFAVIASDGSIVKPDTDLSMDENVIDWRNYDVVELANGRIIAAWEAWGCFGGEWTGRIRYVLLDSAYNRIGSPACLGQALAATSGDITASVTADAGGRAIFTWTDRDGFYRRNLYYALVANNGTILTPPMIFYSSQATVPWINTNYEGYGNTSYSWTPPSGVDGVADFNADWFGGSSDNGAVVGISYANHGTKTATNVVLTINLDSDLTYQGDSSGVTPVVIGDTVTWNFPNLAFLEDRSFNLYVGLPGAAPIGTSYPITMNLTSDGPEANPADNGSTSEVISTYQLYLPIVSKN